MILSTVSVTTYSSFGLITVASSSGCRRNRLVRFEVRAFVGKHLPPLQKHVDKSSVLTSSLNLLEWDKLCESVSSFAGTSLGREASKAQLWQLNHTYEDSTRLLGETNAAVEMHKHGDIVLDFSSIDIALVKSAIQHARRSLPVEGIEALSILTLLQLAETLQLNLKAAIKVDPDWYQRFMPIADMISDMVIIQSLMKFIQRLIDEDGSVKDTASSDLKRSRDRVRALEMKLNQLLDSLVRNKMTEAYSHELCNVGGRWCLKLEGADPRASVQGLLLTSGSGTGSIVEPLSAVPLNDELQQAKASVALAEEEVLLKITMKMQEDLIHMENLLNSVVKLDVINARAKHSISFGGVSPDLFLPIAKDGDFLAHSTNENKSSVTSHPSEWKWMLYLPKAYHPLLLQNHYQQLKKAMKDVSDATAENRRRKQGGVMTGKNLTDIDLPSLQIKVTKLKEARPVPVDIFVDKKTRVLVMTGPNTGGKTICLKTVGLAAMMAKSGLHVLSAEPVKIPWFDSIFADIGDEQSLSQSLSTFSGHLKQISNIQRHSTRRSLVLLDEVGSGTNPIEGAALGMSLLESFAESGAFLTIATTHHGELKTLKYSNDAFENACLEFDEINLKPTYRILWGVPGRSNAISISERLGLPQIIIDNARGLYGASNAEINGVIMDMEKHKQNFHNHVSEAQHHLMLSKDLHEKLLVTKRKVVDHILELRYKKMQEISHISAMARPLLHKKVREARATASQHLQHTLGTKNQQTSTSKNQHNSEGNKQQTVASNNEQLIASSEDSKLTSKPAKHAKQLEIGDKVVISSLRKEATVIKVELSKGEVLVQAGNMKLKVKLSDLEQ
ncbi:endonuclease MutS2 [Impatiens glandulifera]|uniref:endonuclease MutS2 n=1 Tax=Impatiens glandulifera TaxID=253017 RepID=UPI001FB12135|nr:endonuclease MutS2 [Impatiens glandulifera]